MIVLMRYLLFFSFVYYFHYAKFEVCVIYLCIDLSKYTKVEAKPAAKKLALGAKSGTIANKVDNSSNVS